MLRLLTMVSLIKHLAPQILELVPQNVKKRKTSNELNLGTQIIVRVGSAKPIYLITRILSGKLINANLGHSTSIHLALLIVACKFS